MAKRHKTLGREFVFEAQAEIQLCAAEDGKPAARPKISILAYNGGPLELGYMMPVIIDLSTVRAGSVKILRDHRRDQVIGHGTARITARNIRVEAEITGDYEDPNDPSYDVVKHARNGFPWEASGGWSRGSVDIIDEGNKVKVNGRTWTGPLAVARDTRLGEVSIVAIGADENTSTKIAASLKGDTPMDFEKWLEAMGLQVDDLTEEQSEKLQAKFDAETKASAAAAKKDQAKPEVPKKKVEAAAEAVSDDPVKARRMEAAAEEERIAAIRKVCGDKHPEILAEALRDGWDATKAELAVIRAERPKAPATHIVDNSVTAEVLEAACLVSGRHPEVEKQFDAKVLEAASKRFGRGIGLQELIVEAAQANGFHGRTFRPSPELLRAAWGKRGIEAAFSTVDISGILSNVANKFLLTGFTSVEDTWRLVAAIRAVNDFKQTTSYRLTGSMQYQKVAPDGELKHGTLGEESFTNQADTYGLILAITRQDIINDDLGALTNIPRMLGRGGGLKLNDIFWTEWMDNSTFFTAGNANYAEGAATALAIAGLTTAEQMFLDQTDADGKPLGLMPKVLLVPTALSATSAQLMKSAELRDTTASTKYPVANPHQGKFTVGVSSYLGNSSYTGYSAAAWYLSADPNDMAAIEVVFLNGQESPTVESTDADFDTLGIRMRGYHDFGVNKQESRAAAKMKGEA